MSREKQIEEMAKDIDDIAHNAYIENYDEAFADSDKIAESLYNAGYRKQSEGVTDINVGSKAEWISVDERLPETRETILYFNGKWVDACYFDGDSFMTLDTYESDIIYEVTHWMPLPTPPKMKGGAE